MRIPWSITENSNKTVYLGKNRTVWKMASFDVFGALKGKMVKDGKDFEFSGDEEYIGIYFSAHWCPPCRGFTPVLAEYYKRVYANGKVKFEIVFVSSDQTEGDFNKYFKEMPWAALKHGCMQEKEEISEEYGVSGIPTLIILNKDGTLKNANGRKCVTEDKQFKLKFD